MPTAAEWSLILAVLAKLGLGALLGGIVGWERERHGRPAGIRTHILMAVGVVLFSEVSRAFAPNDSARIAAQILTGIGFLGAGTIMRNDMEIRGLTSAASIWAVAAIAMGISVGGWFTWVAVFATLLTVATLDGLDHALDRFAPNLRPHELLIRLADDANLPELLNELQRVGTGVHHIRIGKEGGHRTVAVQVSGKEAELMAALAEAEGVLEVRHTR